MIERYKDIIESSSGIDQKAFLLTFCEEAMKLENSDKLSRWVGFIQGILYTNKLIEIDIERDFSRSIYKPIYEELNMSHLTVEVKRN